LPGCRWESVSPFAYSAIDGHFQRQYFEYMAHIGLSDQAILDLPLHRSIDARAILY
jgi:hypothetical protein